MNETNQKKERRFSLFFGRTPPHLDLLGRRVSYYAPNMSCTYSVEFRPGFICLVDHDIGRSVTNTAREVIADFGHYGYDLVENRVIYQDTDGRWDELLVIDGQFAGFKSINRRDVDAAIMAATSTASAPGAA
jgi:hypothetical protein